MSMYIYEGTRPQVIISVGGIVLQWGRLGMHVECCSWAMVWNFMHYSPSNRCQVTM